MKNAREITRNQSLLSNLRQLMWDASDAIMKIYESHDFNIQTKEDKSPVTSADLAAHNILVSRLHSLTPEIPIVSEEDQTSLSIPKTHSVFWLIDPLDGTKEFIKKNNEFTCNLALIEHNMPTLGFVHAPAMRTLYFGGNKIGARQEHRNETPKKINCSGPQGEAIRVVASKSHLNKETEEFIKSIGDKVEFVQTGSSLKFLKLATGQADIYPRLAPTCEWDTAAAQAILEGAGGYVKQQSGEPVRYGKDDIINPHFIAKAW